MSAVKPYCLAEILKMKPGTILGGLVRPQATWMLAPAWDLPESLSSWEKILVTPFLEHRVRWRQHLRRHSVMVNRTRVYRPPVELLRSNQARNIKLHLETDKPLGIYLGHIIRFNGISLVNVLTNEGYDTWF